MGKTKVDSEMLSAVFDGEGTSEEVEAVLDELENDFDFRETWKRYSMIGAAIRKSDRAVTATDMSEQTMRVSEHPPMQPTLMHRPSAPSSTPPPLPSTSPPETTSRYQQVAKIGASLVGAAVTGYVVAILTMPGVTLNSTTLERTLASGGSSGGILASDESVENDTSSSGGLVSVRTANYSDSIGTSADLTRQRADQYMQRHVQSVSMKNRSPIPFAKAVARSRDSNASVSP